MNQEESSNGEQAVQASQVSFKSLSPRPGLALQVRRLVEGAGKKEAQLFGAIENKGVMVGPQGAEGEDPGLSEGEVCIVRGFTGQYEFSFITKVLQIFQKPFAYALLAYPSQVDARLVRQSMRTKTSWPITLQAGAQSQEGMLVDISPQGAMVSTASALSSVGSQVQLEIRAEVEGQATALRLAATVCHSHRTPSGDQQFTGMAFQGLTQQDKLLLHYLISTPKV